MAIAYFSSLEQAETIDVAFAKSQGGELTLRLLVDSGFTGQSCCVLSENAADLAQAAAAAGQAAGALQGVQRRVVVSCHVAALSFHLTAMAILTDVSPLALPPGVQGLVGLQFLRHFRRWGAEQTEGGIWRFFLATDIM
jgi:predicted aspartyl protease